jgi:N-methylhydantoinase A
MGVLTGAWPVIVPPSPGVLCALGDATTSLRDESARTCLRRFADLTGSELREILTALSDEASARLVVQGLKADEHQIEYEVDVRYFGQGFEIPITIKDSWLEDLDGFLADLGSAFDGEHERLFSFLLGTDHELVNARASVSGPRPEIAATLLPDGTGDPAAAQTGTSRVYVHGAFADAPIYDRRKLRAGDVIAGPAIVVEMDSTTLVLPGHSATTHPSGSLLIRPDSTGNTAQSEG